MNFNQLFTNYCEKNNFEINEKQLALINELKNFYELNFKVSIFKKLFSQNAKKASFYLYGDVGVGKTMILNFFLIK